MTQYNGYCLEITEKGVFLTVDCLTEKRSGQMSLLMQELTARNIENVDWNEVERARLTKRTRIQIGPPQTTAINDGILLVEISDDQMEAYATLFPPLNDGSPLTKEQIMEILSSEGVIYGIDQQKVQDLVNLQRKARVCVAEGKRSKKGRDAAIECCFPTSQEQYKPRILDNGRVDFHNLNLINNVAEGQELARKIPAVPGEEGFTVAGRCIKPSSPRNAALRPGKNTVLGNGGLTLIAKIAGHALLQGDIISVFPVYKIDCDVGLSTGNIDFTCSVHVLGSIKPGFTVNAAGDVEVYKTVEGGFIKAGENIMVKGGVLGQGSGQLAAGDSIYARFFENANIKAGVTVEAGEAIMHSVVQAGRRITVRGKKGKIIGGLCFAGEDIEARVIGSPLAAPTQLEIGISSQSINDLKLLLKDETEISGQLQKLDEMINIINGVKEPDKSLVLMGRDPTSLITTKQNLLEKLEMIRQEKNRIQESFKLLEQGRVRVQECIYPGAVIRFGNLSYYVREEMRHVCFYKEGDEIKTAPY